MQNVSSSGRAQHNSKSINLEANILAEWAKGTTELERRIKVRATLLGGILLIGIALLPPLRQQADVQRAAAAAAEKKYAIDARAAAELSRQAKAAQPQHRESTMLAQTRQNLDVLLGNVTLVVNAAPNAVAFDSIQAEVSSAELTLTCKSQAESYAAGQAFTEAAAKGPNVGYAVQASAMKSEVLAPDGLAFDFIKRVHLEP